MVSNISTPVGFLPNSNEDEQSLQKLSRATRNHGSTEVSMKEQRDDDTIIEQFELAYFTCVGAIKDKQSEFEKSEEGPFDFVCTNLESVCGIEDGEAERKRDKKFRSIRSKQIAEGGTLFKIKRESSKEEVGISFVSLDDDIYIRKVKKGSKFSSTGLQPGMKVLAINGGKCPKTEEEAAILLRRRQKIVEILVDANASFGSLFSLSTPSTQKMLV